MLLPTQQIHALAATNMMQSMLDGIEEQRRQDEEARTGKERDKLTEAKITASEEAKRARDKIASALFGTGDDPAKLKMDLIERLAKKLNIDIDEARSSYKLGKALEDALKDMQPDDLHELAKDIGLVELGVSVDTLLKAIRNPYGDDNKRLEEAFIRQANGGKLGTEVGRVVQRLEAVADPKSLEELKLGPQGYDPTRVEDDETRAELRQDIAAAEAGEKLEDVEKAQDAIEERNEAEAAQGTGANGAGDEPAIVNDAAGTLTILAAAAEQVDQSGEASSSVTDEAASNSAQDIDAIVRNKIEVELVKNETGEKVVDKLMASQDDELDGPDAILPVRQDELGIYELLKSKRLAA